MNNILFLMYTMGHKVMGCFLWQANATFKIKVKLFLLILYLTSYILQLQTLV